VRRKWLAPTVLWIASIVTAIGLGLYARAPTIPGVPPGRMMPRVPSLPPNLPELLFMLGVGSVIWYAAILSIPVLLLMARRIHPEKHSRFVLISGAAVTIALLFLVTAMIDYAVIYGWDGPSFLAYLTAALRQHLIVWIAVAAIVGAVEAARRAVQSRLERQQLRTQVAEQRLIALTGQLQPHFLFNTLQGISTLIHRDPDAADEMLSKLSDLLRDLLKHRDTALVKLDDELKYIRTYLEISKVRFADRLSFSIDADPSVRHSTIPLFILQPLVENALNHGIGSRADGGTVSVRADKRSDRLVLEVEDNGTGLANRTDDGIGLTNTRERLRAMYGYDHIFSIEQNESGGTTARIEVPIQ
jgi:two-component system, LytTR family, sensor kinase